MIWPDRPPAAIGPPRGENAEIKDLAVWSDKAYEAFHRMDRMVLSTPQGRTQGKCYY